MNGKEGLMLDVQDLKKSFSGHRALAGLSFSLPKGHIYGLLGPNGAGKTTTLKILAGLLAPDAGHIYINKEMYRRDRSDLKRRIAYVPDQPFLYSKLTGEEHLHFFADLYRLPRAVRTEKLDFLFRYFEFEEYRRELVENYSAGTKQKLLISQALLVEPDLLLLDEPLVSIDPLVGRKFKKHLRDIAARGTVVIFATHILSLAQEICHTIGVIIRGRIAAAGPVAELIAGCGGLSLEDFYFDLVMRHDGFSQA